MTQAAGMYERDIYLTNDGTVARRKADRAKDAIGHELPPVHRKGELKDGFTAKNTRYKTSSWVAELKENLWQELTRMGEQWWWIFSCH